MRYCASFRVVAEVYLVLVSNDQGAKGDRSEVPHLIIYSTYTRLVIAQPPVSCQVVLFIEAGVSYTTLHDSIYNS